MRIYALIRNYQHIVACLLLKWIYYSISSRVVFEYSDHRMSLNLDIFKAWTWKQTRSWKRLFVAGNSKKRCRSIAFTSWNVVRKEYNVNEPECRTNCSKSICAATRQASKNNKELSDALPSTKFIITFNIQQKEKSIIIATVFKLKINFLKKTPQDEHI